MPDFDEVAKLRFKSGVENKNKLLERVAAMVIRDKLVAPRAMKFVASSGGVVLQYLPILTDFRVHRHAFAQLCAKAKIPLNYANTLQSGEFWEKELLATSFTEIFQKRSWSTRGDDSPRFLHRIVGGELRGFLSRRFNRHLASLPMLKAFVAAYDRAGAQPVESTATDVRLSLKAYLPIVFEAYPGQHLCIGTEFSNSDFGAGRLLVSQTVWDPKRDTRAILDDPMSRVHLGSIIEESDIEMSEETMAKEMEAQQSAITDTVEQHLSKESIDKMLRAVRMAHEEEIPFSKLKGRWKDFLGKAEFESLQALLDNSDVVDLPPPSRDPQNKPVPNAWWASAALSHLANKTDDDDRKLELQREAGRLLSTKE